MAIALEKPPVKSVETLEEGLANIGVTDLSIDEVFPKLNKLVDDHNDPSKLRPHQIYALRLDWLAEGRPLEEAELLGWRYIVGGTPDSILSADVQAGSGDEHVFSAFSQSRIANETVAQLDSVATDKTISQATFNPRLLRVFGLMFAALWLHQPEAKDFKNDIFIPLAGASSSLIAGRQYSGDELAAELHKKAAEQIKLVTDTSS